PLSRTVLPYTTIFRSVLAHVRAREDAARPPIEIVVLEAVPEIGANFGFRGNLMQRDPALDPQPPKVRSEGFPRAHSRPEDCARRSEEHTSELQSRGQL